jgi:hypothetical protein
MMEKILTSEKPSLTQINAPAVAIAPASLFAQPMLSVSVTMEIINPV